MRQSKSRPVYWLVILLVLFFSFCIVFVSANPYGTETLLPYINSTNQQHVAVYGEKIVWDDSKSTFGNIFLYDISNGNITRITNNSATRESPAIYNNLIVWRDYSRNPDWDIYMYNLSNPGDNTRITDNNAVSPSYPAVYGDKIVWQDKRNGHWDIFIYNVTEHREDLITPDPIGSNQVLPAIYGDRIVWENDDNPVSDPDIWMNDTSTGTASSITGNRHGIWEGAPAIYGNRIVWEDYRYFDSDLGGIFHVPNIFMYQIGSTESRVSDDLSAANIILQASYLSGNLMFPSIAGNRVVWIDYRNGDYGDIYLNDTSSTPPLQVQISSSTNDKYQARISGNRIVWTEPNEIHLFTIGTPQTCPVITFTESANSGGVPLSVQFSDTTGSLSTSHWFWDFGDSSFSYEQNTSHVFTANGQYRVNLTISDDYCRTMSSSHLITAGTPVADFSSNTTSGIVPLAVRFTDSSTGSPTSWAWDFENDGITDSTSQNPTYVYNTSGTYAVKLTATNAYGSGTKTKTGYISVLAGAHATATIPVNNITIDNRFGGQFLTYNATALPERVNTGSAFISTSRNLSAQGWQNITFESSDAIGFLPIGNNETYFGNVSQTSFKTSDVNTSGFSLPIGNVSVNYRMALSSYPAAASLVTEVWESATAADNTSVSSIAKIGGFTSVDATGYTARYTRTNLGTIGSATINMSVNSTWAAGGTTYILAIGTDPSTGNKVGMVLRTVYICSDTALNYDYFEAEIPSQYTYFSTFIIAKLSGSGNLLQAVTLSIASRISSDSDSGSGDVPGSAVPGTGKGSGPVAVQNPNMPESKGPPSSVDLGQTASLYANANGVITQATTLQSTDKMATVSIGEGIVARDSSGNPLSSITMAVLPAESVSALPAGSTSSFTGVAYELGPNGATFSPAISLSFTIPQVQLGQEYTVKALNHVANTWQDLPTQYNPETGKITAEVSNFCCFALFSTSPVRQAQASTPAHPVVTEANLALPPPTNAVSIFLNMVVWLADVGKKNAVLLVIVVIISAPLILFAYMTRRRKRMDRIRYK